MAVRAYLRRKRRRISVAVVRWLAAKRLRGCMIAYMSAPLAVVPLLLLTAFFPSSIKASLEHMRSTPSAMPWLDPVNFYLGLAAKGMAIAYLSLLLRDRVSSSVRTADAVLRKAKSLPLSPPDELRPPK